LIIGKKAILERIKGQTLTQKTRARNMGLDESFTWNEWYDKLQAYDGFCHYCGEWIGIGYLTVDHVVPLSNGGSNTIDNIVPACSHCNFSKGSSSYPVYLIKGK